MGIQILSRKRHIIWEEITYKIKNLPKIIGNYKRQLETIINNIKNLI